jgi:quinoprotein dehydrogenase-associated probable ABC transporter substrate-binding protein
LPLASAVALSLATFFVASLPAQAEPASALKVCADPDNLPFSNRAGEGFENRIATELAKDLGKSGIEYTWFPQRMGFVRNTLKKKDDTTGQFACDVIIGVPAGYELTATTKPYMRSTYALIHSGRPQFANLKTAEDLLKLPPADLQKLRIGVFAQSPGSDWLLRNGLLDHAVMYAAQSGDPSVNPALVVANELSEGKIDLAIVWGPIAGYLVREHSGGSSAWQAVPFGHDPTIKFDYEIAMGARFGEKEWKAQLDQWIEAHHDAVQKILSEYRVPLLQ